MKDRREPPGSRVSNGAINGGKAFFKKVTPAGPTDVAKEENVHKRSFQMMAVNSQGLTQRGVGHI